MQSFNLASREPVLALVWKFPFEPNATFARLFAEFRIILLIILTSPLFLLTRLFAINGSAVGLRVLIVPRSSTNFFLQGLIPQVPLKGSVLASAASSHRVFFLGGGAGRHGNARSLQVACNGMWSLWAEFVCVSAYLSLSFFFFLLPTSPLFFFFFQPNEFLPENKRTDWGWFDSFGTR